MAYSLGKLETLGPFTNGKTEPNGKKACNPIWQQKSATNKDRTKGVKMKILYVIPLHFNFFFAFFHEFPAQAAASFISLGQVEK